MGKSTLILVVDDDSGFRALVTEALECAGYRTAEAATGEEALEAVGREQPQLVVLDVRLPGVSGYEVCHQLKEEFGEALPIVFVSGVRKEAFDRVAGFLIGGDDYLSKPFAPDELLVSVRSLVRRTAASAPAPAARLTGRESEILALLADGLDQDEIADRFSISPRTVAVHIGHINSKLGVRTRAQSVAVALRGGSVHA